MHIPSPASTPQTGYNNKGTSRVETPVSRDSGAAPTDVVEFSSSGLAASGGEKLSTRNPTVYSNDVQIKANLARILMETLFGRDTKVDEDTKSPQEELVSGVLEEPMADIAQENLVKTQV
ncbi:MAG: hypothetical protein HQL71_13265 [Magnetococcales bacterium]|nr:hypothetical protein [Magnetococcales bacterium]